ncbi:MAG: [LysW]-aminoadipate kinase [FCB group bacterium]|nr:[LysW]-aminoadipate kinase [FCB group bacterium]
MFVVKVGGSEGIDYDLFLKDLAGHRDFVLVHGGSNELNEISTKLGKPPVFVTSVSGFTSRLTDRETLDIFNMIYAGKMNKMLVEKLQQLGVNAVGLSGIDGRLLEGRQKRSLKVIENGRKKIIRGDLSGTIEKVNVDLLRLLLDNHYTPVITPPAISYESVAINVDGDRCAAEIAVALRAETLIILSNIPGLLKDPADESSLITRIPRAEIDRHIEEYAKGRMKKKLLAAKEALEGGVKRVILGDARVENQLSKAFQQQGTVIE